MGDEEIAQQIVQELTRQARRQGRQGQLIKEVERVQEAQARELREHREWRDAWDAWTRRSKRESWLMVGVLLVGFALAQPAIGGTILLAIGSLLKALSLFKGATGGP